MPDAESIRVEYVSLDEIQKWPRNPKLHNSVALAESVERFGFVQPVTIDEKSGQLVAGHGRLEALQKLKADGRPPPNRIKVENDKWLVPVVRGVSFKDSADAEAFLLADNRLTETGGWNDEGLAAILKDLKGIGDDALKGIGWDAADISALLQSVNISTEDHFASGTAVGPSPEEYKERFDRADIKQVVLYFEGAEFEAALKRVKAINDTNKLDGSATSVFKFLLDFYEKKTAA